VKLFIMQFSPNSRHFTVILVITESKNLIHLRLFSEHALSIHPIPKHCKVIFILCYHDEVKCVDVQWLMLFPQSMQTIRTIIPPYVATLCSDKGHEYIHVIFWFWPRYAYRSYLLYRMEACWK
jgi:hypothetical protein